MIGSRNSCPSVGTCLSSWSESRNEPKLAVDLLSDAEDDMSASDALLAWGVSRGVAGTTLSIKEQDQLIHPNTVYSSHAWQEITVA